MSKMPVEDVCMFLDECYNALREENERLARVLYNNRLYQQDNNCRLGIRFLTRYERTYVDLIIRCIPETRLPYRIEWEITNPAGRTDVILVNDDKKNTGYFEFEPWFAEGEKEIDEIARNVVKLKGLQIDVSKFIVLLTSSPYDHKILEDNINGYLLPKLRKGADVNSAQLLDVISDFYREFPTCWDSRNPSKPDNKFAIAFIEVRA